MGMTSVGISQNVPSDAGPIIMNPIRRDKILETVTKTNVLVIRHFVVSFNTSGTFYMCPQNPAKPLTEPYWRP